MMRDVATEGCWFCHSEQGVPCFPDCQDRILEAIRSTPAGQRLVEIVRAVQAPSPALIECCRIEYERQFGPDAKLTDDERTEKRLRDRLAEYSEALTYIERHVPGGIQIVAAAMGNCRPEECPALQALHTDRETAWGVPGRYVQISTPTSTGPMFPLRTHWEMLRNHLGDDGYRRMVVTGEADIEAPDGPLHVVCVLESALSDADLMRVKELWAQR